MRACRHEHLRRSRRRRGEYLYGLIRLRPYRCTLCHKRMLRYAGRPWLELPLAAGVLVLLYLGWQALAPPPPPPQLPAPSPAPLPAADDPPREPEPGERRESRSPEPSPPSSAGAELEAPEVELWERRESRSPEPGPPSSAGAEPEAPEVESRERREPRIQPPGRPPTTPEASPPPPGPRLQSLQASERDRKFRLEFAHSGGRIEPRLVRLDKPPRLIMDLPGDWQADEALLQRQLIEGDIVRRIRIGLHPGKLRIVMDLTSAEGLKQRLTAEPGRLEFVLTRAVRD